MNQWIFVLMPVWVAVAAWFAGALARFVDGLAARRIFGWSWLIGSVAMWIHIVGSYAIAYQWSHTEALLATAEESERVTGIRAGWGVYVNFCFALIWSIYSVRLVLGGSWNLIVDRFVFWFTAGIVLMATVVFEEGAVRVVGGLGFVVLGLLAIRSARDKRRSLNR